MNRDELKVNDIDNNVVPMTSIWGRRLIAISDSLDRISKICFVGGIVVFAGIMLIGVFFRYVLNNSLVWSDEMALIWFVWAIMLAIASGYLNGSHIHFDLLIGKLTPHWEGRIKIISEGLTFGFLLSWLVSGIVALPLASALRTDYFHLPYSISYIALPVCAALMLIHWTRMNLEMDPSIRMMLIKILVGAVFFCLVYFELLQFLQGTGVLRAFTMILALFGPMLLGVPVAVCLGLMATLYMGCFQELDFQLAATQIFNGVNNYSLMAVPLLILSGKLMHSAGLAKIIVNFAQVVVGRVRGGLGSANVVASYLFGDISGSAVSDTAAIGTLMIPQMKARGYAPAFCAALQGTAGSLGMMAPLSITLLLYASSTNASVSRMAMGTIFPALLVAFSFMLLTWWHARQHNLPRECVPRQEILPRTLRALPGLFALVIVIGGIMGGICTPAEVGTILLTYILLLSIFLYHTAKPRILFDAFVEAGYIAGMTLFLVGASSFVGFMLARDLVAISIVDIMSKISMNSTVVVLIVSLVITVLGMILEPPAVIFAFMPSFLPLMAKAHVDPIYFGVLFCVNAGLGCILPPVALNLFVSTQLAEVRYEETIRACVPFIIIMIVDYLLLVLFPVIPLWLPHILFDYPLP